MNPNELIQRYLHGEATGEEIVELDRLLASDPALRRKLIVEAGTDAGLRGIALEREAEPSVVPPRRPVWFSWRPLTAAAAGIVLGMLCTSLVHGLVTQRMIQVHTLLDEGFEDAGMIPGRGLPQRAGVWSGDLGASQGEAGNVKPSEGLHMVTLPPVERRKFSYAFRFVDLSTLPPVSVGQTRQIEVSAQFHGALPEMKNRFQIRLAAFAEDSAGAREIWLRDHVDEQALLHVAKTVRVPSNAAGWTLLRSTLDVPAGARLVLVSLAAGVTEEAVLKTPHFLDDVHVRLITRDAPLP